VPCSSGEDCTSDSDNRYSPITIIALITSKFDTQLYPTGVLVKPPEGGLRLDRSCC